MNSPIKHIFKNVAALPVVLPDMCDSFTGSFPEFVPFCEKLYFYSSRKQYCVSAR
jgi:hypothetical protein